MYGVFTIPLEGGVHPYMLLIILQLIRRVGTALFISLYHSYLFTDLKSKDLLSLCFSEDRTHPILAT